MSIAIKRLERAIGDLPKVGMQTGSHKVKLDLSDAERLIVELNALQAERDALAAQVNAAFADVFLLSKSLFEAVDVLEREFLPALEDKEPLEELIAEFRRALGKSPEAHLAAHDAEVAKAAFIAGAIASVDVAYSGRFEIEEDAESYADRIRVKSKP